MPAMNREELARALADAHLPSVLLALVETTGDLSLLRAPFDVAAHLFAGNAEGDAAAELRALAGDTLGQMDAVAASADAAALERMLSFVSSPAAAKRYVPYILETQEALVRVAPTHTRRRKVCVVGAGLSGLHMAIRLRQGGYDFSIVEKNADVGGTWFENTYPGCRVDTPGALYSYTADGEYLWADRYPRQEALRDYYRALVARHGLQEHIRFGTQLVSATFDEATARWRLLLREKGGGTAMLDADVVVSAAGQLNMPSVPAIEGHESFAGPAFHSARWPRDLVVDGKRAAVIGTGASAYQIVPAIAPRVAALSVFQRSAPWPMATPGYRDATAAGHAWLVRQVPAYGRWHRLLSFLKMAESGFQSVVADPDWRGPATAVSRTNAFMRVMLVADIRKQFEAAGPSFDAAVPQYPFGAKRPLRDDGAWLTALQRANTALVTTPIARIASHGVITADGKEYPADILVYATGFQTGKFLPGVAVVGRGGRSLEDIWAGEARAFLGVTVPGFPNFFFLYGPNTNIVINGSTTFMSECAAQHVMGCLDLLESRDARSIEPRPEAYARFNADVDAANKLRAWGVEGVSSWYKNATGRVTQNWPFSLMDYWEATRTPRLEDYRLENGTAG